MTRQGLGDKTYVCSSSQFVVFKLLSYSFKETIKFDVRALFASRPLSRLIRWDNKPGNITKEFWEKVIQFHGTFHRLKITNFFASSFPNERYYMLHKFYRFLALNNLHILVFVYHGFYEISFFFLLQVYLQV